jgi:sarcosine oxidase/L-pipecolate oxidase
MARPEKVPSSILIVGHGVFGLSTALALSTRPLYAQTQITVLDRSPFPSPDGSSIDNSRIIRADYSDPAYASLAASAQEIWRRSGPDELGGEGRYTESGLVLVADRGAKGEHYVRESFSNVCKLMSAAGDASAVRELQTREEIDAAVGTGGGSGDWGYINTRSGWADASAAMLFLRSQVEATGRVTFRQGEAQHLVKSQDGREITGVRLTDGDEVNAELIILATGAWTGKLVDLRGRAQATGQVLMYLPLTEEEQTKLNDMPVLLNMSTGLFIIPPRNRVLKVARHAYGYSNPVQIPHPDGAGTGEEKQEMIEVSLPRTSWEDKEQWVPKEGEDACREALREMIPRFVLSPLPTIYHTPFTFTSTSPNPFPLSIHPSSNPTPPYHHHLTTTTSPPPPPTPPHHHHNHNPN